MKNNRISILPVSMVLALFGLLVMPLVSKAEGGDRLSVYVVNYPLQYFAERVGGDLVEVHFPAPAGVDPSNWVPEDAVVQRYQQSDVIFLNGATYEKWVGQVTLPDEKLVDTSAGFKDHLIEIADAVTHTHGAHGAHTHAGVASRTWLDPQLSIEHARVIKETLVRKLPDQAEVITGRFEELEKDLQAFDHAMNELIGNDRDQPLLTSHPVYQYLGARYRLNLKDLHWEPEDLPGDAEWEELDKILAEHPAKFILWEDTPLDATVERLEERGITSVVYDKCRNKPAEGDFLTVMWQNHENLKVAFAAPEFEVP